MIHTIIATGKKGFTLIELMIVISILGILASIIIPVLFSPEEGKTLAEKQAIIDKSLTTGTYSPKKEETNVLNKKEGSTGFDYSSRRGI